MFYFSKALIILLLLFTFGCNKNLTEEEKKEMWSKAQTTGAIIERSGTKFNSGINKQLALRDAETRLQSGGGLFKDGLSLGDIGVGKKNNNVVGSYAMPINKYLWQGALETVNFMPLTSADPIGGTILTDWYSTANNENERCKLNIFISGNELKTQNLKVTSFCQDYRNQKWINKETNPDDNIKIENAILNKAKKLKIQSS